MTFILVCPFVFPHFRVDWDFASDCILSQDIQVIRLFDENLGYDGDWVEGLDGIDSEVL